MVMDSWEKHVNKMVDKIMDILDTKQYGEITVVKVTYALQVLIGEVEKIILLCILFYAVGHLVDFIIAFTTLILLRPFTGGMHRKTILGCFLHTLCNFCLIIFSGNKIMLSNGICVITILLLIYLIIRFSPIQSSNRIRYSSKQRMRFKIKGVLAAGMIALLGLYISKQQYNIMMFVVIVHTLELAYLSSQLQRKEET